MAKYYAIFTLSFINGLKNYKALIGLSIFLMTCLLIFAHLWNLAAAKVGAVNFSKEQLLWYIAFNEWVLVALPDTHEEMEKDLKTGRLAYLLPRPISYLGSTFAEALGTLFVNLIVLGLVTFAFTWFQTGSLPFEFSGLIISVVVGFAAGILAILFQMIVGLTAFWLQEVAPFYLIWEKFLFMFGGLILPLAIYPEWMQTLAAFTPFPLILGGRSALALNFSFELAILIGLNTLAWILCGVILLMIIYRKGLRILNIEGG